MCACRRDLINSDCVRFVMSLLVCQVTTSLHSDVCGKKRTRECLLRVYVGTTPLCLCRSVYPSLLDYLIPIPLFAFTLFPAPANNHIKYPSPDRCLSNERFTPRNRRKDIPREEKLYTPAGRTCTLRVREPTFGFLTTVHSSAATAATLCHASDRFFFVLLSHSRPSTPSPHPHSHAPLMMMLAHGTPYTRRAERPPAISQVKRPTDTTHNGQGGGRVEG